MENYFEGFDFTDFWDDSDYAKKEYIEGAPSDELIADVERELGSYGFLRCNTCYLVNPKFIVRVKGSEVQVGDRTLQISRPRRAAFMEGLTNWYAGAGGGNRG